MRMEKDRISKHYTIFIEELISCDLSGIGKITVNQNAFWENIDIILPVTSTDEAMKNGHFRKAFAIHRALFDDLRKLCIDSIENVDVCIDEYLIAYEEKDATEVTAANLLGLWVGFRQCCCRIRPVLMSDLLRRIQATMIVHGLQLHGR